MRHISGQNRKQAILFPEVLDNYVPQDSQIRFIDNLVDSLDLQRLGYAKSITKCTGRKPYHPGDLLKLYLYGYLHKIRSSRGLEKETRRNIEVMWLLKRLSPHYKTIADFRKLNSKPIENTFRLFIRLCKEAGLYRGELLAIDGSYFKAVNSKEKVISKAKLTLQLSDLDEKIKDYLKEMDRIDTEEDSLYGENDQTGDPEKLRKIIEELQKKKQNKQEQLDLLESQGISQQSLTDPDAKLLQKRHTKAVVGYNIQTAVDSKYHLIVAYDITNRANDKQCLYPMINKIKEVTGHDPGNVVADSGYYNGVHIHNADKRGVKTYIPIINTSSSKHNGRYDKTDFTYLAEEDAYRCPAGKLLELSGRKGTDYKPGVYRTKKCKNCKKRHLCTTNKNGRTINRYAHEESLIGLRERNINNPEIQRSRKTLVEHPFGTLKENWGYGRFLVKGNEKVRGEMGLMLLAYNLKRVMNAGKSQKVETSSKR